MEMAEDVVQDALLQLYAELRSGHFIENPRAWAVIVVRRQAAKQSAARRRQVASWLGWSREHQLALEQATTLIAITARDATARCPPMSWPGTSAWAPRRGHA